MPLSGINNFRAGQTPNPNNIKSLGYLFGALMTQGVWDNGCAVTATATPDGFVNIGTGNIVISIGEGSALVFYNAESDKLAVPPNPNNNGSLVFNLVYAKLDLKYDLSGLPTATFEVATGGVNTDPVLPNNPTLGIFCVPICRVAKTFSSTGVVVQSEIITTGNTNNTLIEPVRQVSRLNGSTKALALTQTERLAQNYPSGTLVLQKETLDANNTLHINTSTTATPLWKQIVLVTQSLNRWALTSNYDMGSGAAAFSGTFALTETLGLPAGGLTLPANFWGIGKSLKIRMTENVVGSHTGQTPSGTTQYNKISCNFLMSSVSFYTNSIEIFTGNPTNSQGGFSGNTDQVNNTLTTECTIECTSLVSNIASFRIYTENIIRSANSTLISTITETSVNSFNQSAAMPLSFNFTKSAASLPPQPGGRNNTTNNLTAFVVSNQV